jgi:peptide deformylase
MMVLLKSNNPLLRIASEDYDFENSEIPPMALYELLRNKMCELKTLGLSAPQLGIMSRVFVFGNPDEPDSIMPVFNPKIVNTGDDHTVYEEQCSTFPGLFLKIKRPTTIRMRYTNLNGDVETHNFQGMTARVAQHEVDHLDGVLFTDRANLYHLQQAKRRKLKMDRVRKANDRQAVA